MKYWLALLLFFASASAYAANIEEVAASRWQWTGIAVTDDGSVFVNFPRWSDKMKFSVGKLDNQGLPQEWPNPSWNSWKPGDKDFKEKFVAVQSVVRDAENNVWVVDTGNPFNKGVITGAARLFKFDSQSGNLLWTHTFAAPTIQKTSYLNDVRIDAEHGFVYLTDSGAGALIAINLADNKAHRFLGNHPSTKAEEMQTIVNGKPHMQNGKPAKINADSLEYDAKRDIVYYKALTARTLYSIPAENLRDFKRADKKTAEAVKTLGTPGPTDGFAIDADGTLYLTPVEQSEITTLDRDGETLSVAKDPKISWPDSLSMTKDNWLYFTTSQLQEEANPSQPYRIFKVKLNP